MRWGAAAAILAVACGRADPPPGDAAAPAPRGFEPPVATNPESPVDYPPDLFDQTVEGTVVLRLFADSTGRVHAESTRVAEGSGNPTLDSAALAGVARMRFAPARRDGVPVAATFLQPIYFRHPDRTAPGGLP